MSFTERLHLLTVKWTQMRGFVTRNQNLVEDGTRDTQKRRFTSLNTEQVALELPGRNHLLVIRVGDIYYRLN